MEWVDLLGAPYDRMDCRAVAVAISRRAGRDCPSLEDPRDFDGWELVGDGWAATARDGDVILARDNLGNLYSAGVVEGGRWALTSSPGIGAHLIVRSTTSGVLHTYRWPA